MAAEAPKFRRLLPPSKAVAAGVISKPDTSAYNFPFGVVAKFFEKVIASTKHAHKIEFIQTLFKKWGNSDSFPLIRLLLPQFDRERQAYGLKEVMLAKAYIKILGISKDSDDAQRMLNWRKPTKSSGTDREGGDFAHSVYKALETRHQGKGDLSVDDVNYYLDMLNTATEKPEKEHIMKALLQHTTPAEHKWLVRIILRDLKIGLSEKTILGNYHDDAVDYFNVTSDLRKVCTDLKDKSVRISHQDVQLFSPVKPMLANRHPPEKVVQVMGKHEFVIETKWDGERIQVHRDKDDIRLFSRKGNDVTDEYGLHVIPHVKKLVRTARCILDGELMLWDANLERWEQFGQHKTFSTPFLDFIFLALALC
jgi:DNA ligase 4